MSYIIKNGSFIASTADSYKSGEEVDFAYDTSKEALNADIDVTLINKKSGKISNAKKWNAAADMDFAVEVNEFFNKDGIKEFVISSLED